MAISYISVPKEKYIKPQIDVQPIETEDDVKNVATLLVKTNCCSNCQENNAVYNDFPKQKTCPFLQLESCKNYEELVNFIGEHRQIGGVAA